MAVPARSVSDFQQNIKMPPAGPEAISNESIAPTVSPEFLKFYKNIVALVSQYQLAFEKENFNRMSQYVITINNAITNYFKKNNSETKSALTDIAKKTAEKAKELFSEKTKKALSKESVKDEIEKVVDRYKALLIAEIKKLAIADKIEDKDSSSKKKDNSSSEQDKNKEKISNNYLKAASLTINSANAILKKQELTYAKELNAFAIDLGAKIITNFKDILSRISIDNIQSFQKNIEKMQSAYDKNFLDIVTKSNDAIKNGKNSVEKAAESRLMISFKVIMNVLTGALGGALYGFFFLRSAKRLVFSVVGKAIGAVTAVLNFAKKLLFGAVKIVAGTLKFVANTIYRVVSFGVKTIRNVAIGTFNLSKFLYGKIKKLTGIDFWTLFGAFIVSYPGAYFLGFITGRIWRLVLRAAGISDMAIATGDFSIKDDILMPFFKRIHKRMKSFDSFLNGVKDDGTSFNDKIKEKIKNNAVVQNIITFAETVKNFATSINWSEIHTRLLAVNIFFNTYVSPVIETLWSLISAFAEGYIEMPKIVNRTYIGAKFGISKAGSVLSKIGRFGRFIAKHPGGFAAILAGGLVAAGAAVIGQVGSVGKDGKTLSIKDEFKDLWSNGKNGPTRTNSEIARDRFKGIFKGINRITEDSKDAEQNYKAALNAYTELLNERSLLADYKIDLDELAEKIDKEDEDNLASVTLAGSSLAEGITNYNGVSILSEPFSHIEDIRDQMQVLRGILDARKDAVDKKIGALDGLLANLNAEGNLSGKEAKDKIYELIQDMDEFRLYLPERMKAGAVSHAITKEDIIGGTTPKIEIALNETHGQKMSDVFKENTSSSNAAWAKGISIGSEIWGPNINEIAQAPRIINDTRFILEFERENAFKKILPTSENYRGYVVFNYPEEFKRYRSFLIRNYGELYVAIPGNTVRGVQSYYQKKIADISLNELWSACQSNDYQFGYKSEKFKEFIESEKGNEWTKEYYKEAELQDIIAEDSSKIIDGANLKNLFMILSGVVRLYTDFFINDFKTFLNSKELSNINISIIGEKINAAATKKLTAYMQNGFENDFSSIFNGNEKSQLGDVIQRKIFEKASTIFNEVIKETLEDPPEYSELLKDFYTEHGDKEKYSKYLGGQVESFIEQKTNNAELIKKVSELIDKGKRSKQTN